MTSAPPNLPPFDVAHMREAPFPERVRMVCQSWAAQVAPNPRIVMALYWAKYLFVYAGVWAFFVSFDAGYPGFGSPLAWAFTATAFQKALAWSIFYELLGLGCSWGPMNGRLKPMTGGFRYFLRPGTTKLPLFPGAALIGRHQRGALDVAVYAANQLFLLRALVAPEITPGLLLPSLLLIPAMGVLDKTLFLAARAEHYWVALACLVVASGDALWISGCKLVWCAIWFWAATSKVNDHFPSVIQFMMNNGPFCPKRVKGRLFVSFPDDLRPSPLARLVSRMGTATEYALPFLLVFSPSEAATVLFLCLMVGFHAFIALNNPSGMPIEWNLLMIYGGIFLFGVHREVPIAALASAPLLLALLLFWLVALPCLGNFFPAKVSFLLSMRYYAGNWAYNVWLVRKDALAKLDRLVKPAGTMRAQLTAMGLDEDAVEMALMLSLAHRFMHFEGRPLLEALPRAVERIDDYEWIDGEVLGGSILGWNFGDGHLNGKHLLAAIQPQCRFEPGEVRVVSVESSPLFDPRMAWTIHDAATGAVDEGRTDLRAMRDATPWPSGRYDWSEPLPPPSVGS